ncbi:MAG: hypothetical protein ABR551_07460 [Gemmatimonadales bacterium]
MRRLHLLVALAVFTTAGEAGAQTEIEFQEPTMVAGPWKFDNFPYFTVTPNDGFMLIGRAQYGQSADFLDRVSMAKRLAFEGGWSPSGSRFASLRLDAPRLAAGWRLSSELRIERANRMGYYGLGNDRDEIAPDDDSPYVNRVRRNRALARVEVTRELTGPLSLAVAGGTGRTRWTALEGFSSFGDATNYSGESVEENDTWGRVALVVDLRDNEYEPKQGALIEGGVFTGSGGEGYTGWYALLSGYARPAFGTVLAARLGGRSMSSEAPLTARYEIQAWEREISVLGGPGSHRALAIGRFVGHSVLFGSVELRQQIVDAGDWGGVYGLAFLDAGRVFEHDLILDAPQPRQNFRLTTDGLKVGGGIGVGLRILRANVLSVTAARGPDGTKVMVGSGWSF